MEKEKINQLMDRFSRGVATAPEIEQLEALVEQGIVSIDDLQELKKLDDRVMKLEFPEPSTALDDRFYQMLALQRSAKKSSFRENLIQLLTAPPWAPKLAFALALLVMGLAGGYWLRPGTASNSDQMELLTRQVTDLKEMMMLALLEKESATDRLKAVGLTQEMNHVSHTVTMALLQTLNQDENVNVRLAALEALKPYGRDSHVREELINSIALQESPLVQIALAETMVALQVKSSVPELEKIIRSEKTPDEVKKKINESIQVLI